LVQLLAGSYLSWYLVSTSVSPAPLTVLLAVGFVLWMINLYNFMDGSNGMAGFQGVFAGCALTWLFLHAGDNEAALVCSLIAAACLGFLPWNLGRARVFMGDVASGSLGFAFAALLMYGVFTASLTLPVAWLVMLVFLCDASLTLFARVMKGERWYNPHKQHLYQRLILRGWSHVSVLALYQSINLVLVAPAIAVAVNWPAWATIVASATTIALGLGWLLVKKNLECSLSAG
jgi:UDP-N-acetylmuramyl pentapeptide phosphotransferase/UDP-N-acetylglucosamine-1-phosphate transferase